MNPLPRTSLSYVSAAPYVVAFQWLDGRTKTLDADTLWEALRVFWMTPPVVYRPRSADRRLIIDARATVIFGVIDLFDEDWTVTDEVIDLMEDIGGHPGDLIEMRLSCMYANEMYAMENHE